MACGPLLESLNNSGPCAATKLAVAISNPLKTKLKGGGPGRPKEIGLHSESVRFPAQNEVKTKKNKNKGLHLNLVRFLAKN